VPRCTTPAARQAAGSPARCRPATASARTPAQPSGATRPAAASAATARRAQELLVDAGLDEAAAESDVRALHDGRVLVLVTTEADVAAHI
jgi:hypothetical protein